MDNLGKAYLWSVIFSVLAVVGSVFSQIVAFVFALIHLFVVGNFIGQDAISRGKSKHHQLWAFFGIIGVVIYHIGFARK